MTLEKRDPRARALRRRFHDAPESYEAALAFGALLFEQGAHGDAVGPLEVAASSPRDDGAAARLLAGALAMGGHVERAAALWRQAAERRPHDAGAKRNEAFAWQAAGKHEESVAAKRAYLSLVPLDAPAWADLGASLVRLGRHGEAMVAFLRAKELKPALFAPGSYEAACFEDAQRAVARS